MVVHKIVKPDAKKFMCDQCGIVFYKKDRFVYHLRLHLEEPKYCPQCNEGDKKVFSLVLKLIKVKSNLRSFLHELGFNPTRKES